MSLASAVTPRWPQAVLFDLDGTLIDSAPDIALAINGLLASYGRAALPLDAVRSFIGNGVGKLVERAFVATGGALDAPGLEEAIRRMMPFYAENLFGATIVLPGAVEAMQAVAMIGMPEGRIVLGQACTYLATAPKSNASYKAIDAALEAVRRTGTLPVPLHIRNAPTKLMTELGYGKGYRYPHDHGGWVPDHYLPEALRGARFYEPEGHG